MGITSIHDCFLFDLVQSLVRKQILKHVQNLCYPCCLRRDKGVQHVPAYARTSPVAAEQKLKNSFKALCNLKNYDIFLTILYALNIYSLQTILIVTFPYLAKPYQLSHFYFCQSSFYLNALSSHR